MIDDLHVYIHWPFCRKKCRYCDFISLPERSTHERSRYLEALNRELRYRIGVGMLEQATLQTIYFGGGTPSLMTKDELSLLIEQLESIFPSNNTKEVTLEINPSTISNKTLNEMIECGVNRLSVGIQTFQERYLRFLGRSQTADENREILKHLTQRSPRIAFNVDLIYGLPFQSLLEWQKDLEEALEFHPAHLSIYNLTLHPMVPIARFSRSHPAVFPDPEREALMFQWTMDRLSDAGYIHYEISNFAFPGHEARHNLAYWRNDNTLGLGLGAWSFLDGVRERNAKHFCHYLAMIENNLNPAVFRERLMPEQGARETFFLALRTNRGADLNLILESTAGDPSILWRKAENLQSGGFINIAGSMIFLTRKGILVANQVIQELID